MIYDLTGSTNFLQEAERSLDDILEECGIDLYGINEAQASKSFLHKAATNLKNLSGRLKALMRLTMFDHNNKDEDGDKIFKSYNDKIKKRIKKGDLKGYKCWSYDYANLNKYAKDLNSKIDDYVQIYKNACKELDKKLNNAKFHATESDLLWTDKKSMEKVEAKTRGTFVDDGKLFYSDEEALKYVKKMVRGNKRDLSINDYFRLVDESCDLTNVSNLHNNLAAVMRTMNDYANVLQSSSVVSFDSMTETYITQNAYMATNSTVFICKVVKLYIELFKEARNAAKDVLRSIEAYSPTYESTIMEDNDILFNGYSRTPIEEAYSDIVYEPEMIPIVKMNEGYYTEISFLVPYMESAGIEYVSDALDNIAFAHGLDENAVGLLIDPECSDTVYEMACALYESGIPVVYKCIDEAKKFETKQQIDIWGKKFNLRVSFRCYSGEEILNSQRDALNKFLSAKSEIDRSLTHLKKYCLKFDKDNIGDDKIDNIFKFVAPKYIFVSRSKNPEVAIMCDYKFDPEHGLAIVFKNGKFSNVGPQDIIL